METAARDYLAKVSHSRGELEDDGAGGQGSLRLEARVDALSI